MTYRKLAELIEALSEKQKDMEVIHREYSGEYYSILDICISGVSNLPHESASLPENHPYLE